MSKHYDNIKIRKLPQSEVEILGEITPEFLEVHFIKTLKKVAVQAELPGFRRGHAPENIVLEKYGEINLLGEAAESALDAEYANIIESEKLRVIGQPQVTIRKLARNNPLEFGIVVAVVPEVKLPDYKKLAKKQAEEKEVVEINDTEVDQVILEVRKHYTHDAKHKRGEFADHNHAPLDEKDLEPLTDEIVKSLGEFSSVEDLKEKVKENLTKEKIKKNKEKKRLAIIDSIIDATEIEVPGILIENELDKMMGQFEDDIAKAGIPFDDYIKNIGKGKDDMKVEWRETAVKKAKAQLVITKIAEAEKITPDADDIRNEAEKILMVYKEADPLRVRVYVAIMMTNEKVLEFLETAK